MLIYRIFHLLRTRHPIRSRLRKIGYRACGMKIGPRTRLAPVVVNWPHFVWLDNCFIEDGVVFKVTVGSAVSPAIIIGEDTFVGRNCEFNIANRITVGSKCLIASGCKFIDHDHQVPEVGALIMGRGNEGEILIEDNVWLGSNVIVLKSVRIGTGAVVGANSVVTKAVPPNEIWAGSPAKKIGERRGFPVGL